jgi:hypothetical protein
MKLLLTAFIVSMFFSPGKAILEKWVIEKNSNLCIEGRSNVSSFRCDVIEYLHPDTIQFCKEDIQQQQFIIKGGLSINVNSFDCHQRYITGDLRKTLKADASPLLKIDLLSIGNLSTADKNIKGIVAITLAGVSRKMEVDYTVQTSNDGYLHLSGSRGMLFSDFGLTPPHKLAGLIKVEEQINVRFLLILRSIQSHTNNKSYLWNNSLQ